MGREGGHAKLKGVRDLAETVDRAFAAALYAQDDAGLDTGASLLVADQGGWAGVGRELLARGEAYVRQGWERGWRSRPTCCGWSAGTSTSGTCASPGT